VGDNGTSALNRPFSATARRWFKHKFMCQKYDKIHGEIKTIKLK